MATRRALAWFSALFGARPIPPPVPSLALDPSWPPNTMLAAPLSDSEFHTAVQRAALEVVRTSRTPP